MLWRGRRRSLKSEWKRIGGEETRSLCSLCEKVAWFFKQQIEFLLISFLVVAESFIKTIYTCVKSIFHLLCWVYKKNNSFLSFHSSIFHSKKFISILHVKWTGMNKGEQVENLKFWVNILFEWPQSLFAATKIYILIFNLTHSLISLMGSFHFPQWKIFLPIHW